MCPIHIGHIVQLILTILHLKLKIAPLLSRFQQYNIHASLDRLELENRGVGQKKNYGPLGRAEGLACADPGARTPISASGNYLKILLLLDILISRLCFEKFSCSNKTFLWSIKHKQ